ncbi:hypothetical protein FACS189427_10840 [Planctomycetales bacterium]|nr:hypothetical protein FACS189427_10840 [Planctomycetales bacterium]
MRTYIFLFCLLFSAALLTADEAVCIRENSFQSDCPIIRAERTFHFTAIIDGDAALRQGEEVKLTVPAGDKVILKGKNPKLSDGSTQYVFETVCAEAGQKSFTLELCIGGKTVQKITNNQVVLPPHKIEKLDYIPEPKPLKTKILIGAHNCPLWEREHSNLWNQVVRKHQERTPALGIYAQDNPEIADWETKWALEHGVSFFIYCWYRTSQGKPVETKYEKSVFDDALFKSKFGNQMKFTIMWENQSKGHSGIADEKDLTENLMPYWINKFFKRDNYLIIDNKPVLFVYRPEVVSFDLGGDEKAKHAFNLMRDCCKKAGFDGLYILGEYRGTDAKVLQRYKNFGLDYTFAYCWHIPDSPAPKVAVEAQLEKIRKTQELHNIIPQVITLSQAWSGWRDEGSIWKLPPEEYENLLQKSKEFIETNVSKDELGSKMLILDNWNEWSEGHYIAPYREYGFGYLDAVRKVFGIDAVEPHEDLLPEDIGFGTYSLPAQMFENRTSWTFITDNPAAIIDNNYNPWRIMMNIKDFRYENNCLCFESSSSDPAICTTEDRLPAANFGKVVVSMKTSLKKKDSLQFLWKNEKSKDYSEKASVRKEVPVSDKFVNYELDLSGNPEWSGKITDLRLDPVSSAGITVEIESIRLLPK